jgi:hypothetical protein
MDRKSLSVLFLLWLIGWGPWISASVSDEGAGGQARPAEEPSSSGTDAGRDPEDSTRE